MLDVSPIAKDDEHDTLDTRLQLSTITSSLSLLDERERNVLTAYFGIGEIELTMQEIADKYGLKRERVRQIRDKALRKLRKLQQSKI